MSGYHVTLTTADRPVMHGWWDSEATARDKYKRWIGRGTADARVVLADEATGETLDEWPENA